MNPILLSRLEAHALEVWPVKIEGYDPDLSATEPCTYKELQGLAVMLTPIDVNEDRRAIYLSGLVAFYEKFAREIVSEAITYGIAIGLLAPEKYEKAKDEYLKQFDEPDKK